MSKVSYNQKHKEVLDSILLAHPKVKQGKMYGYPSYYVGKRLFACVHGDAVGVKVPEGLAEELLIRRNVTSFRPMGRPKMREWIQLNRKRSSGYAKDEEIFLASIEFVSSLPAKKLKRK